MVHEDEKPESISCSKLAAYGYPHTYFILQEGLQAIGWRYYIGTDSWYPPEEREMPEDVAVPEPCNPPEPAQTIGYGALGGYSPEYGYANTACAGPIHPLDSPAMVVEKQKFHIQQCVAVLRQAYNIRHDATLMTQIRLYIRNEKDELTDLLDEIR